MADESTQADATALVAMTVADLAQHLDGVDLATLLAAKELEQAAPSPRKGALAALDAAIEGHPELSASAAEAADAADAAPSTPVADAPMQDAPVEQPAEPAPVEAPAADPAPATDVPAADIPAMTGVPEESAAELRPVLLEEGGGPCDRGRREAVAGHRLGCAAAAELRDLDVRGDDRERAVGERAGRAVNGGR